MKKFILALVLFLLFGCEDKPAKPHIIPKPNHIILGEDSLSLSNKFLITYSNDSSIKVALYLQESLTTYTGINLEIKNSLVPVSNSIHIMNEADGQEAYNLLVMDKGVIINGSDYNGQFYGVQTLLQLVNSSDGGVTIPYIKINDSPKYSWRGAMLDVARHFFSVEDVKRYIDLISIYKINRLHLHLSDDQGWRIEIESWPRLTEIGSITEVGGTPGGYYTKEDYREIVSYAMDKGITVVPEVDMPGHVNAVLVSYPELDPDSSPKDHYTGIDVGFSSLDLDNPLTYKFLEDVIGELAEMTPGNYIHIGGDEAHKSRRAKYNSFILEAEKIISSHNKVMIGWEEISRAGVRNSTVVQKWLPRSNLKGSQHILSPANKTYLDMKYSSDSELGLTWAGYIHLKTAYSWDPENYYNLPSDSILGIEAPLWSETLESIDDIEYMAFPRILAYSELGWSSETNDYTDFKERVEYHYSLLELLDVNFYRF